MKTRGITLGAWIAIAAAAAAWAAVAAFAWTIQAEMSTRSSQAADARNTATLEDATIRLHALARDTKDLRDQLDSLAQTDVLTVVNTIESVGQVTGVAVKIGDVVPTAAAPATDPNAPTLYEATFVVETDGSFQALMRTAALFEHLPLLSSVDNLELERVSSDPQGKSGTWHGTARIRVLSTSPFSS